MHLLHSVNSQLRGPSLGLLVALSTCLVLNFGALIYSLSILTRGSRSYTYLEGDRPHELPLKVRTIQAQFRDDPDHYGLEGPVATAEWNEIRPPGKGFVFLGEEHFAFGVSMWHQMHCLNHIRAVLVNGDDGSDHTLHCFHYLRQGILCAADTTIEPGGTNKMLPNGDKVAAGDGAVHTCRDWRQVHDWMESEHGKWTPDMYERIKESSL
ncbi:Oxidase ustYa [Colletotrichum trifolii]|uniref:Oxidase ustYa n=1 Tax=Colletotrichum trifolii TaxID=5466 RepID=A0A4R8QG28_COLTR|nr:Oxidase ustYa [Colletotrichum trifolii]